MPKDGTSQGPPGFSALAVTIRGLRSGMPPWVLLALQHQLGVALHAGRSEISRAAEPRGPMRYLSRKPARCRALGRLVEAPHRCLYVPGVRFSI